MLERTETNTGLKVGKHVFTVSDVPVKKRFESGSVVYEFVFEVKDGDKLITHKERIPVWLSGPILKALGAKEIEPGVFEWEKEETVGKMITADIVMEPNPKDGKSYRRMKNFEEKVPF